MKVDHPLLLTFAAMWVATVSGCASCTPTEDGPNVFTEAYIENAERLSDIELYEQFRGDMSMRPPVAVLAPTLAQRGDSVYQIVADRLRRTRRLSEVLGAVRIFQHMKRYGLADVCADRETLASLEAAAARLDPAGEGYTTRQVRRLCIVSGVKMPSSTSN